MQLLPLQVHLFLLYLCHILSGVAAPDLGLGSRLSPSSPTDDKARKLQDLPHDEPKRRLSWTEIYIPVKRCHAILKNKIGEFSIPVVRNRHFKNIWCNWTIWAGPRNHIIIYVQGFRGSKDCEENQDKIIFQGVASIVESSIAYACWNKRMHVYATQALAVNVALLLKTYSQRHQYKHFRGKYYIFRDPRARTSEREDSTIQVPFQRPSSKLPYTSPGLKVELPIVMSQRSLEITTSELMPSKTLQPERSFSWEREKFEFSETSLPFSEGLSDIFCAGGIMVTKTLGMDEMSLGDGLFSKTLGKTVAFDTRWLEIIEEKNILSPGSTLNDLSIETEILYENTPYLVGSEQSTIMENWTKNIKSGRTDNQTNYLIHTSEDVPINIKPTVISHSVFTFLSDSEFLERTEHSKNEKIQISPSQIWSKPPESGQQSLLQTQMTFFTDSMGNHMSSISLVNEIQLTLEGSLHLIPVVPTVNMAVAFSPKSFKNDDLLTDPHSEVVTSLEIVQSPGGEMIWSSSQEVLSEAGFTLIMASPDGMRLVPELPSTISIRTTVVRAEDESEPLLQITRSLPGPAETANLASSISSEDISSRYQASLAEADLSQEMSLLFTRYQKSLFDAKLTLTLPQEAMSEIVPEWVLPNLPMSISSVYHNEQVIEQSLGIPLAITLAAMLEPKWPSMGPVETRAEMDAMLIVQSVTTPFASVNHEESMVATMLSLDIPLSHHTHFSKSNMEYHFSNPTEVSLAFLPTPTLGINEDEFTPSSLSRHSWADPEEMLTSIGKTEPPLSFTSRNIDLTTIVSSPRGCALSLVNLFDVLLEGEPLIKKETQNMSQLVPKDASLGIEIPLITKTYEMTPLSALQWTPSRVMNLSWELGELQNEVTVQPSKKDAVVNEFNPWKASNSLGKDKTPTKFNFTYLLPSVPTMSLDKYVQTGDLSVVASSLSLWSENTNLLEAKTLQDSSEVLTSTSMTACIPIRRCHVVLKDTFGTFSLPENLNSSWLNICCNWTIWAGSKKHIVVYIRGLEGSESCDLSQDKIIFQGVSSSVERKTYSACRRQGTLIFATQALAVHVVFLSLRHIPSLKGEYFVFTDPVRQVPPKLAIDSSSATSQKLRERTLSNMSSYPELVTKPWPGSFPNPNTIYMSLENKGQMVTEMPKLKNKKLVRGEGKALDWKYLHSLLPLALEKVPLIRSTNFTPILFRKELSRPTETIKISTGSDSVVAHRMTSIPITPYGYKSENKASQDDLPMDSFIFHPHWSSKTFPLMELLPKPVGISDRSTASVQKQRLPWITARTEKLVWQGDLATSKSSKLYSRLTAQGKRKPQEAVNNHDHLYQSLTSHVMLVKGKNFLEIRSGVDKSITGPSNIPKEDELFPSLLFNEEQIVAQESSATGKEKGGKTSPTSDELSEGVSLDPVRFITLGNIRLLNEELLDRGNSRKVTTANVYVGDSISPDSLTELLPSLKTLQTPLNFLREVTDEIHPSATAAHSSAPIPNLKAKEDWLAKAMMSLVPGQMWKTMTVDGVLVLTPGYSDAKANSPSFGNETVLDFQHYPGDILYEVAIEMDYQVETPYSASEVEKVLEDSFKQEIGEYLDHFSPEADAFKLTRIKRKDTSNATFIFWLHLRSRGRNMSDNLMSQSGASESSALQSQLRTLIRDTVEALQLHLKSLFIHDVNECEIGLGQCGEGAECFNGVGSYICHCKDYYEDRSPMQIGTLCVHVPHSGVEFSFSYLDLLISVVVFATIILLLIIVIVWLATRTTQEKRNFCLQKIMTLEGLSTLPQTQTKPSLNQRKFSDKCSLHNPYPPKLQARVKDDSLEQRTYLGKDSRVYMEESEYL
ncbi:uncharacterized protein LOC141502296 [Macrotis lagotis]|uniref:uncharacterized protein LOC141502296 n=1 Tax=Macrotis lagotis TaxID=92651 RepID=UPI003D698120